MSDKKHETLLGETILLLGLDQEEAAFVREVRTIFRKKPDWGEFGNFWREKIRGLYDPRGVSRKAMIRLPLYRYAQDLEGRLAVIQGEARLPDYRDQLAALIRERFKTQRAFCKATGLAEDLVSHVLAGRKHLGIDTLGQALDRIGYRLTIETKTAEAVTDG